MPKKIYISAGDRNEEETGWSLCERKRKQDGMNDETGCVEIRNTAIALCVGRKRDKECKIWRSPREMVGRWKELSEPGRVAKIKEANVK